MIHLPARALDIRPLGVGIGERMHSHLPNCLDGPVSGSREWWRSKLSGEGDPTFRVELVARIRREIAAGTYDTPQKLETALDELVRRCGE